MHLNILMFFWVSEVKEKIDSIRTKYILVCWCHFYTAKISGFDINCFDKWEIEYYVSGYGNSCFYLWEKYEGLLGLSLHIHFHTWLKHYTVSVGLEGPKSFNVSQSSFAYSSGYKSISTTLQHYISIQIPVTFTGSCWHSLFVSHLCNLNILLPLPRMRELSFQFQSPTSFTFDNVKLKLRFTWRTPDMHLASWPSYNLPLTFARPLPNLD